MWWSVWRRCPVLFDESYTPIESETTSGADLLLDPLSSGSSHALSSDAEEVETCWKVGNVECGFARIDRFGSERAACDVADGPCSGWPLVAEMERVMTWVGENLDIH